MKGAVNVISIIIISGIVISLMGAAYMWSGPIINKGETANTYQTISSFALGLNGRLIDIANSGGGEGSMDVPPGASVEVYPHNFLGPVNNTIIVSFPISQPLALNNSEVYLGGASFFDATGGKTGTFGESSPSIVSMSVESFGTGYLARIKILFRSLLTENIPVKERRIALNDQSNNVLRGSSKISFAYDGSAQPAEHTTLTKMRVNVA